uniref:Apolipoprotein C-III n=1 Tax=Pavo cristatus TaxID=9049 RepID=A0A8C9EGH7_PAVCR
SALSPAMKVSILLLLICTAILATEVVVKKVQEYVKQATEAVKTAFTTVHESEAAQQARRWLSDNANLVKQQLARLKEQLPGCGLVGADWVQVLPPFPHTAPFPLCRGPCNKVELE